MTIDEAIIRLSDIRSESKLGGKTCLAICLVDSEIEYVNVQELVYESDQDGALVVVKGTIGA
jgi:hypothetical protein